MSFDPDTKEIQQVCNSLIGSEIHIEFKITLRDGSCYNGAIDNCNIIGDCMEDILYPIILKTVPTFQKGPKQASPDFFNRGTWEWELKCFSNTPGFDISNFNSYISQLEQNLERKLYKTQYLIFKYTLTGSSIKINDFKLCNVWEMINYTGKYPISLQSKKDMWYNIRPCSFADMKPEKTADMFITQICKAIHETPNKLNDKEKIVEQIQAQYHKLISTTPSSEDI